MAQLARLSGRHAPSKTIENVRVLLTRAWSKANWRAREEIVATTAWLLKAHRLGAIFGEGEGSGCDVARPVVWSGMAPTDDPAAER